MSSECVGVICGVVIVCINRPFFLATLDNLTIIAPFSQGVGECIVVSKALLDGVVRLHGDRSDDLECMQMRRTKPPQHPTIEQHVR